MPPPIHETAYPVLPAEPTVVELQAAFTPTPAEIRFARSQARQTSTSVLILVQLKLLQRLGYFPLLADVPISVIAHVGAAMRTRPLSRAVVARYDASGSRARHQKLLRAHVGIQQVDAIEQKWLESLAMEAARTKSARPDSVNVLIEELVRFAQEPARVYRHQWRAGDAVLWDNRCTQHCATRFDADRYTRRMHRTTLEGEVPILA